ncbi:MAG: ribonuclease Z [Actinomycetes bacterium]
MAMRELVVLGTAAQVPTRTRNQNGYFLRWDAQGLLFDPGEGTQRQMILAGVSASSITRVAITHAHGDHCLGLPGVLQRLSLDRVAHPVDVHYPAGAARYVTAMHGAAAYHATARTVDRPVERDGPVAEGATWRLLAGALDHRIDTYGYRLEERPGRRMLPDRLGAFGVAGPDVGRLARHGELEVGGRRVRVEDVSVPRPGQVFAFVMDTRACEAAVALARGADLLVCEATFLEADRGLADRYAHLTARQAGLIARAAGARRLVLTHFSQRYGDDAAPFLAEAAEAFPEVIAARDLDRVPVPPRTV